MGESRWLAASPNSWLFLREGKFAQARKSRASENSFSRYCILVFPPEVWHNVLGTSPAREDITHNTENRDKKQRTGTKLQEDGGRTYGKEECYWNTS